MSEHYSKTSFLLPIGGAVAGATTSASIGGVGLVGSFGGIGLGIGAMTGVGALVGAAAYGAFEAVETGDTTAYTALGLGAIGGVGVYSAIGGMGLGVSGTAFSIGLGTMAFSGGIVGLGIYGLAKMLNDTSSKESFAETYTRMDEKVSYQEAYNQAMMELDPKLAELAWEQKWREIEIEEELKQLKAKIKKEKKIPQPQPVKLHNYPALLSTPTLPAHVQGKSQSESQISQFSSLSSLWDCQYILKGHYLTINALAISPDNQIVASGGDEKTVILWNLKTGKQIYTFFGLNGTVQAIDLSPNGKTILAGGFDNTISSWDLATKKYLGALFPANNYGYHATSHQGRICALAYSPNQKFIVSSSGDKTIKIWSCLTKKLIKTLAGHNDTVWSVAVTPDSQIIASGSSDQTIRVWHLNHNKAPQIIHGYQGWVTSVAINSQGNILVSSGTDGTVRLWNLLSCELICTLLGHTDSVFSVVISPDDQIIATASLKEVLLWNLSTGELIDCLNGCHPIIFSNDGQFLVTSNKDSSLKVWSRKKNPL